MSTAYEEAKEAAEVAYDHDGARPEALMAMGYRAAIADITSDFYKSMTAEKGNPKQILVVFHDKLATIARKFEKRAKELGV